MRSQLINWSLSVAAAGVLASMSWVAAAEPLPDPNPVCEGPTDCAGFTVYDTNYPDENEIPLYISMDQSGRGQTLYGSIGGNKNNSPDDVVWTTTDSDGVVSGSGFATIQSAGTNAPATTDLTEGDGLLNNVKFELTDGRLFKDVVLGILAPTNQTSYFKVTVEFSDGTVANSPVNTDANNPVALSTSTGRQVFMILADSGKLFKSITIDSRDGLVQLGSDGLDQTKQWKISGVVPIPAAAWLFGSALLGMAGIGYRRGSGA